MIDSTFFASSSKNIMDEAFNSFNNDVELEKIYNTSGHDKTFSMVIKPNTNFSSSFFVENYL